jgi:hypothetical protein
MNRYHLGLLRRPALIAFAALVPLSAFSQTSSNYDSARSADNSYNRNADSSRSWLPYTHGGYWGFNLGTPDYEKNCASGFTCDDPSVGGKIYTGGQINKWLGAELGYINFGKLERNGGDTKAQGINLSLVGTIPVGEVFSVFGKVGTTYGWTKTDAAVGATGNENGFGLSYGAGLGFNLNPRTQLVAEWDKHEFKFADRRADADLYSVGLKFRF